MKNCQALHITITDAALLGVSVVAPPLERTSIPGAEIEPDPRGRGAGAHDGSSREKQKNTPRRAL
ncbi:hypothetical protein [Sorangium sp. So ce1024]|uniref:hypothetical protein n=1 Tax=unclassified Sorangium TaxID=2621164 RepID=UPI003F00139A